MLNPCCCISPRIGALIFGVVDLILGILYLLPWIQEFLEGRPQTHTFIGIGIGIFLICLACLLLFGALKNNADNLRIWLFSWVIFLIVILILSVLFGVHIRGVWASSLGLFLVFLYEVWVVLAFYQELRGGALTYCPTTV